MPRGIYVRTPAIREAIRQARLGTHASEETKAKIRKRARRLALKPSWRKRVSEGTRRKMREPSIRRKHLVGLRKARAAHGVNFTTFGGNLVQFEKEMAKVLCPLGYVQQHHVQFARGKGNSYRLDFALITQKICIECDGPKHRSFSQQEYDKHRDAFLKNCGWKVIRVLHD